jgi:hypothetical protein
MDNDIKNSSNKLAYEDMKYLYEGAYQAAMNALFKANFDKHGWSYDQFIELYHQEEEIIDFMIDPNATLH